VAAWFADGKPEQTSMLIGDLYWWDYGRAYRSFSPQERGLLSALSDGVSVAAVRQPALQELRWRLHTGVLLGEFRLVAEIADGGATKNSALKEVFELVTTTYLGLDSGVIVGRDLVATPEFNKALSQQQTGAVVQLVWSALPAITQQYLAAAAQVQR
jgi:hypothetical protein